jgi:hypothetical protein
VLTLQTAERRDVSSTNIGDRERRFRLVLGGVVLAAGLWIGSILVARDAAWGWRLLLFPLFYQGIRFIFDYRTGTCPLKAELGQRKLDGWMTILGERIEDPALSARIRSISRRALLWSVLGAVLLTAGVMAL